MISGSRIAGRFAFCAGRARRIPPARVWRFCTAPPLPRFAFRTGSASFHAAVRDPNRFPSPAQVCAGPQDPSAPRPRGCCPRRPRPLRRTGAGPRARTVRDPNRFFPPAQVCAGPQDPSAPRPRGCCPRRPRPLRNGRAFAPNRRGSPGPDHPNPNRFSSPAQVRAGRAGPFRAPPRVRLPAPAASFAQRARLCAEPARVPGPGSSEPKQVFFSRTGPRRPRRTLPRPAQSPAARAGRVLCATGAPLRRTGAGPRARTV